MSTFEETIAKLIRKRDNLSIEIARIDQAIEALRSASASFVNDDEFEPEIFDKAFNLPKIPAKIERAPTVINPDNLALLARRTLLEVGRPLKRGALVRALEERSIPVTGKDKAKNLGTILWRHEKQFVSLEGLGYWPRDKRYRNIYDPANPPDGITYEAPADH